MVLVKDNNFRNFLFYEIWLWQTHMSDEIVWAILVRLTLRRGTTYGL